MPTKEEIEVMQGMRAKGWKSPEEIEEGFVSKDEIEKLEKRNIKMKTECPECGAKLQIKPKEKKGE